MKACLQQGIEVCHLHIRGDVDRPALHGIAGALYDMDHIVQTGGCQFMAAVVARLTPAACWLQKV
jgi:hypothetical protein